ncbi:MAG: hypothetical protein GX455_03325, partial [Phycisphaerae bacterium]|nr:hypothetical protein [Phycisphaerae bacterium]
IQTDFALIVDPDVHIFAPRWDSFCIESLKKWNAWAMGAPYPRWKVGKYHDFPSPVFFFFRRELVNHIPIDWRPYNDCPWCNGGVFVLRQFGRLGGLLNRRMFERSSVARCYAKLAESLIGTFSRDTGWRIAHAARKQKLPVILFEDILPQAVASLDTPADPVWTDLAGEFELFAIDNRPILVHRYGTGGRPWRTPKGNDESFWFACIDKAEAVIQGIKPPT